MKNIQLLKYMTMACMFWSLYPGLLSAMEEEEISLLSPRTGIPCIALKILKDREVEYKEGDLNLKDVSHIQIASNTGKFELTRGDKGTWSILDMKEAYPIYQWATIQKWGLDEGLAFNLKDVLYTQGSSTSYTVKDFFDSNSANDLINKLLNSRKNVVGHELEEKTFNLGIRCPRFSLSPKIMIGGITIILCTAFFSYKLVYGI